MDEVIGTVDIEDVPEPTVGNEEVRHSPLSEKANKVLEESKDKFNIVLVIGLDTKGHIDINSNLPQYPTMQYMINRAGFELLIHEKNSFAV